MIDKPKVGLDRSKTGRAKGTVNKNTAELKEMILGALSDAGGRDYLARQAEENPGAFMSLIGRVLPKDVNLSADSVINIILHNPSE